VLVGGQAPDGAALADTWTYAATTGWTPRCGTVAPATAACPIGPHVAAGAATGPTGVILYGGFPADLGDGSAALGDAWRWDGAAWQSLCDTCDPGARGLLAMAGNGSTVVLYGGIGPSGPLDDTWVYDGTTWTNPCGTARGVDCGPGPLMGASMAWDGTQFVLFGGAQPVPGTPAPVDDTWMFDGTTWTKACGASGGGAPCGPPARELAAFSHAPNDDPARQGALLAEGGNLFDDVTQSIQRDAWLWQAGAWTAVTTPWDGPPVTWSSGGSPPPGDWPLLGVALARPDECQVLYQAAGVTSTAFAPSTYVGGRDLTGDGAPSGCTLPPPTPTSTIGPPPTSAAAGTASTARIAKTGGDGTTGTLAVALACVALGGACVWAGRRRFTTGR
jgi:hypothetical protein